MVAIAASACVGSGKTARTASIEPLPDGMSIEADAVDGCRDGESGFDYRFLVVGPASTTTSGPFIRHLRDQDFIRTVAVGDGNPQITPDLPWSQVGMQHRDYSLRAEIGRLDRYLADPAPHTGPPVDSIPDDVREHATDYVIVALRPSDFQCHTPL